MYTLYASIVFFVQSSIAHVVGTYIDYEMIKLLAHICVNRKKIMVSVGLRKLFYEVFTSARFNITSS